MTMGMGLLLIAVGAILRYAVEDQWDAVDLTVVGLILIGGRLSTAATNDGHHSI